MRTKLPKALLRPLSGCIDGLGLDYWKAPTKFACFHELLDMGFAAAQQVPLPLVYRDVRLDAGYRLDIWVDRKVIVEVKAVDEIHPVHIAQVLTYLKLTDNSLGSVLNFHTALLKNGIRRIVNNLKE